MVIHAHVLDMYMLCTYPDLLSPPSNITEELEFITSLLPSNVLRIRIEPSCLAEKTERTPFFYSEMPRVNC